jgi:hypothetical protein
LLLSNVASGAAMQAARDDYRHVSKDRQMLVTLPKAWTQLIEDEDEMLLEIVADRVESLCGFKPDPDMVAQFLKSSIATRSAPPHQPSRSTIQHLPAPRPVVPPQPIVPPSVRSVSPTAPIRLGFTFKGKFRPCKNAIDVLRDVFETLIQNDPSFPERFAGLPKHGNKRRYLARDANELYPGRPDLCRENAVQLTSGWWLGTNHSRQMIARIIEMACDAAGLKYATDLVVTLG